SHGPGTGGRGRSWIGTVRSDHLAVADELRREFRYSATLGRRAAQDQSIAAVLNNRLGVPVTIGAGDLSYRLKSQYAPPAELPQPGERILEAVDSSERIELVHDEPQPLISLSTAHRLEDREPNPRRDHSAQRCDLSRLVGDEEYALSALHPFPHGERCRSLRRYVLQRRN